ncbi:DUF2637 domain-containing protein [Actinomadura rudentiformis]|uniref:DUF2637 domain-containing protein n=1 Tax=Actinomadura rudentiformis TaxID=359158 RepID=A0A6H9YT90_9ACTN|nr:DUF2637 domain-containing protein [Actinomadura rudentiformis]KAB2347380.1 DUF2637 domain-containing protein [Actinomadura rudentiformis]
MTSRKHQIGRGAGYGIALLAGVIVFANGTATSFDTLSRYAGEHQWLWGPSLPLGLDVAIFALLLLDWLRPNIWLRGSAWILTGITVVANGAITDGSWLDRGLHGLMPALAVIIVEAARRWARKDSAPAMDKIRASRWVLSPIRTAMLKRRMVLWEVTSYAEALTRESAILHARTLLVAHYGKDRWRQVRKLVPLTLRHQLATGQLPSTVLHSLDLQAAVGDWVSTALAELTAKASSDLVEARRSEVPESEDSEDLSRAQWDLIWDLRDRLRPDGESPEVFAQAIALAREQFEQAETLIRNDDLAAKLKIGKSRANAIGQKLRTSFTAGPDLQVRIQDSAPPSKDARFEGFSPGFAPTGLSGLNGQRVSPIGAGLGGSPEWGES